MHLCLGWWYPGLSDNEQHKLRRLLTRRWQGHGVVFELSGDDAPVRDLERLLPPGFEPSAEHPSDQYTVIREADHWVLSHEGQVISSLTSVGGTASYFTNYLMNVCATRGRDWCYLHSGVVAVGGRAFIFPGRSGAGKSTLVAALVRAGAAYLSDEFGLVADDGSVHPFPRHLRLGGDGGSKTMVDPRSLGAVREQPATCGAILFVDYLPGSSASVERCLDPAEALAALSAHAVSMNGNPEASFARLRALIESCPAYRCSRGEAEEFAPFLIERAEELAAG